MALWPLRASGILLNAAASEQEFAFLSGQGAPGATTPMGGASAAIYFRENAVAWDAMVYVTYDSGANWAALSQAGAGGALTITDGGAYYTTDTVDGALDALSVQIGGDSDITFNFTEANVLVDNDAVYAALEKLDLKWGDLASAANTEGASLVALEDVAAYYTTDNVEAATAALGAQIGGDTDATFAFTAQVVVADNDAVYAALDKVDLEFGKITGGIVADPGTGLAIPVTKSALVPLTIGAGVETNTCAIPTFAGQRLVIVSDVQGAGTRAITFASAINATGNTIATFTTLRQTLIVEAIQVGGVLAWEVVTNNGTIVLT